MRRAISLYGTSIGKKYTMAVTGLILFLFIVGHLMGNLKVFQGPVAVNHYGEFLRTAGAPIFGNTQLLLVARVVLLAAVGLHIVAMVQLWRQSNAARATGYRKFESQAFSYASHTMKWGGITIALFVIYHILHYTTGTVHPDFVREDIYHNMVVGFQSWPVSLFYMAAVIALGFHLYHGVWSTFQTLGLNSRKYDRLRRHFAFAVALIITVGYLSIPAAVLAGVIR